MHTALHRAPMRPEVTTESPQAAIPGEDARLRILLYGLNFHPEPTGIGKYTGEMALWLAEKGHEVRVVTAPPFYPDWRIASGYTGWQYRRETYGDVVVLRTPLWVPKTPGGLKRLLHLASFAAFSLPQLLREAIAFRPHLVWCVAPALSCAPGAVLAARISGALPWLHIQDFEIDAAFDLGILRGAALRRSLLAAERALLLGFRRVSTISGRMVERLGQKGVPADRAVLFPNWVDTSAIRPMPADNAYRRELGISASALVALYSGTMGAKQGLEVLADAARRLADHPDIRFVLCGEGAGRRSLEAACAGLGNVHWLPLQPVERLPELLATADVHLLPQRRAAADLVLPSKLGGMLASGRPIIAGTDPHTEIAEWIEGCGVAVAPEDSGALANTLLELRRSPERLRALGQRARERAEHRLARDEVMRGFMAEVNGALHPMPQRA